jgi:hypothetical protein
VNLRFAALAVGTAACGGEIVDGYIAIRPA